MVTFDLSWPFTYQGIRYDTKIAPKGAIFLDKNWSGLGLQLENCWSDFDAVSRGNVFGSTIRCEGESILHTEGAGAGAGVAAREFLPLEHSLI